MNTEHYHKLLQKFYDGKTSRSEEELLKNSEYLSAEESVYFEALEQEKRQESKLNFNDFLALAEGEKVVPISQKTSNFKWVWLAASLILMFSIGAFWFVNNANPPEISTSQIAAADLYNKEKVHILKENSYEPEEVKNVAEPQKMADTKNVLDDILPKKSRMKKRVIARYVDNKNPEKIEQNPEYESGYVIINGHKITNEKDAIDVTKYSFQIIANNVNKSVEQADVLTSLNPDN